MESPDSPIYPPPHLIADDARDWDTDVDAERRHIVRKEVRCRMVQRIEEEGKKPFREWLSAEIEAHKKRQERVRRLDHTEWIRLMNVIYIHLLYEFAHHKMVDGKENIEDALRRVKRMHTIKEAADLGITHPVLAPGKWLRLRNGKYRYAVAESELRRYGIDSSLLPDDMEMDFDGRTTWKQALNEIGSPERLPADEETSIRRNHAERWFRIRVGRMLLREIKKEGLVEAQPSTESESPIPSQDIGLGSREKQTYTPRQHTITKIREVIEIGREGPWEDIRTLREQVHEAGYENAESVMRSMRRAINKTGFTWKDGDAQSFIKALESALARIEESQDSR